MCMISWMMTILKCGKLISAKRQVSLASSTNSVRKNYINRLLDISYLHHKNRNGKKLSKCARKWIKLRMMMWELQVSGKKFRMNKIILKPINNHNNSRNLFNWKRSSWRGNRKKSRRRKWWKNNQIGLMN